MELDLLDFPFGFDLSDDNEVYAFLWSGDEQVAASAAASEASPPNKHTDEKERVEHIRAKNRRSQSRRRAKVKAEHEKLQVTVRKLEAERNEMRSNVTTARQLQQNILVRAHKDEQDKQAATQAYSVVHHPRPHLRPAPHHMPSLFTPQPAEQRPMSSFCHREYVSYADVAAYVGHSCMHLDNTAAATPPQDSSDLEIDNLFRQVQMYRASRADQQGCKVEDICWLAALPYEAEPGLALVASTCRSSIGCSVAWLLCCMLTLVESAFLEEEIVAFRAHLETFPSIHWAHSSASAACDTSHSRLPTDATAPHSHGPQRLTPRHLESDSAQPEVPDSRDVAKALRGKHTSPHVELCCAFDEVRPVAHVVPSLVASLLTRYHATLNESAWRTVTTRMSNFLDTKVSTPVHLWKNAVHAATRGNCCESTAPDGSRQATDEGETCPPRGMGTALGGTILLLKCTWDSCVEVLTGQEARAPLDLNDRHGVQRQLQRSLERARDLQQGNTLLECLFHTDAPVLTRRLNISSVIADSSDFQQEEEEMLSLAAHLTFQPSQQEHLSNVWSSWLRSRQHNASLYSSSIAALSPLPSTEAIPASWRQLSQSPVPVHSEEAAAMSGLQLQEKPTQGAADARPAAQASGKEAVSEGKEACGASRSLGSEAGETAWAATLLGANEETTLAAVEGVHLLRECLMREGEAFVATKAALDSSSCISAEQRLAVSALQLRACHGHLVSDVLRIIELLVVHTKQQRLLTKLGECYGPPG